MITVNNNNFYSSLQRCVFVHPDDDLDDLQSVRHIITDVSEMAEVGTPTDPEDGEEFELYAILAPGETFPPKS